MKINVWNLKKKMIINERNIILEKYDSVNIPFEKNTGNHRHV